MSKHLRKVREEEVEAKEEKGLVNGNHHYLVCSNCDAGLVDIFVTRPNENMEQKAKAKCPFCDDESYVVAFKGGFHHMPYNVRPDDANAESPVFIANIDIVEDEGLYVFDVGKKENAEPIIHV